MATIQSAIRLNDMMSAPLRHITNAMDGMLSAWNSLESSTRSGLDVHNMEKVRAEIKMATQGLDQMEQEQKQFNKQVRDGANAMDGLGDTILGAIGAYAGLQGMRQLANLSDSFTQTYARLNMINDGVQTTDELFDKIAASANRSRASISATADTVAKLSLNAGDAFASNDETILFAENLNKLFAIAGTEQQSIASASLQLTQALGSGVLRGEEFNAVFEAAPNIMQTVADYMDVPVGKLRSMAQEGKITADVVKNALLSATGEINEQFESMPMTWGQVWTGITNKLYYASIPLLRFINLLANNWSVIEPIVLGIATAVGLYTAALLIHKGVAVVSALVESVRAASTMMATGATFAATAAQHGFNAALLACPITWIVLAVIALIAGLFALCAYLAKTREMAKSAFGVMAGGINVVIQFFKNLGLTVANIAIGMWNALGALCTNISVAFGNTVSGVQAWFYGLLSTALKVVAGICEALNKLPFVEFDFSGISAKADEYATKAQEAANNKGDYVSVADAFNEGFGTFDTFGEGWVQDAFAAGAAWGDGVSEKASGFFGGGLGSGGLGDGYSQDALMSGIGDIPEISDIASNTGDIKDALDITHEDLKYLRDLAEQRAINRFTTAEIRVNMGGVNNTVNQNTDLDGVIDYMVTGVQEAMERVAEGVHS